MPLWRYMPRRGSTLEPLQGELVLADHQLEAIIAVKNSSWERWRESGYQDLRLATPQELEFYRARYGEPLSASPGVQLLPPPGNEHLAGYRPYLIDLGGKSLVFAQNKEQAYRWAKSRDSVYTQRENISRATQDDVEYVIHGTQGESPDVADEF